MKVLVTIAVFMVVFEAVVASGFGSHKRNRVHPGYHRCNTYCNSQVLYVCGSDGKNYINECALNKASCQNRYLRLTKVYDGLCEDVYGRLKGVVFNPICVTDGNTYSNPAFKHLAQCLRNPYIRLRSKGPCSCGKSCNIDVPKCSLGCPKIYDPVCGDDGETYANGCALEKQNCILGGKALKKAHNGICKIVYPRIVGIERYSQVCGSDGNTYSSKAFVEVARCQNRHLRIVKYRACNAH